MSNSQRDNVVIVKSKNVSCDGGGGALGHPRIYMDMAADTSVRCKYCDRIYKLDPNMSSDTGSESHH